MSSPRIEDTSADHEADQAAIQAVIAHAERAFNTNDDLLVEHMAENVSEVGVNGDQLDGRPAVLEASRLLFAGPARDQHARYELVDLEGPPACSALWTASPSAHHVHELPSVSAGAPH